MQQMLVIAGRPGVDAMHGCPNVVDGAATNPSGADCRRTWRGTAAALLFGPISCANAQTVERVCEPVPPDGGSYHLDLPPEAIEHVIVRFDLSQLQAEGRERIHLCLPGGGSLPIIKAGSDTIDRRALIWRGRVEGDNHSIATFSIVGEVVVGDVVTSDGRMYRVDHVARGVQVVMLLDPRRFPPEGRGELATESLPRSVSESLACPRDSADRIDVMVLYTQAACASSPGSAGGQCTDLDRSAIEAKIYQAVSETNQTYANSDVTQGLSLVYVDSVDPYVEAQTLEDDWKRLRLTNGAEGTGTYLDDVHDLRNQYAADAVVLITKPTDAYPDRAECGVSLQMSTAEAWQEKNAFSVVPVDCATGNFSFGHELGHVMGADHNQESNQMPHPYDYSHGLTTPTWRTVMADPTRPCSSVCNRVPYWSNPNKSYQGASMGIPGVANNALALNNTDDVVSNFRTPNVCGKKVWMKDTWQDTGAEPDSAQANEAMWKSPYIWLRNSKDPEGGYRYQHQNQQMLLGSSNWAYIKMHNGGVAQASGDLKLYIADASTGLAWQASWKEIGSQPVTLAGNSTGIVEFELKDLPRRGHHCLLARWLSPADQMTYTEGIDIERNVRGNNNIIWRNVNIVDLTSVVRYGADLLVENPTEAPMRVSIDILPTASDGPSFLSFGRVQVELDQALKEASSSEGAKVTGFSAQEHVLHMTSTRGASLEGLYLPAKFKGRLKISFGRPSREPYPRGTFTFDIVQSRVDGDRKEVVGGVTYEVHTDSPR